MIKRPTVFVLGAGASAPYGFPLGEKLSESIQRQILISNDHQFIGALAEANVQGPGGTTRAAKEFVRQFATELQAAGRYSIDEFLPQHSQYRQVGKLAIALQLIPHETDERLIPNADYQKWTGQDSRWYRYFFNQLLTSARGAANLSSNRVTFVTFNFDRSFERALYLFVRANASSDAEALEQLRQIPIFHLHGQLARPAWLSSGILPSIGERPYDPAQTDVSTIRLCAEQIRIADEEVIDSPELRHALAALEEADVVAFLGFSYHSLNLPKIKFEKLTGKRVLGTAYGIPPGRRTAIKRTFHQAGVTLDLFDLDVLKFLQNTDLIYD